MKNRKRSLVYFMSNAHRVLERKKYCQKKQQYSDIVSHGDSTRYHGNRQSNHRCYGTTLSDPQLCQIKYLPNFLPLQ